MHKVIDDDLLEFMGKQESQFLIEPSSLIEQVRQRFAAGDRIYGDQLPWTKTHECIALRPGEVSLWAGVNGHGKSMMLSQVCAWSLLNKWLIASMEMLPEATMERMIKQIAGTSEPPEEYQERILRWSDNRLWLYDQTDSIDSDRILALIRYAASKQIKHVVIDSLIKCGINREAYDKQAAFVDKLCWLAKSCLVHVHLVHHIRKSDTEKKIPDKFDIRGAGEITDLVDNIFIVHRNKSKEDNKQADASMPDAYLKIAKQRHFAWEGIFGFYFHKSCNQYSSHPTKTMNHWVNV